MENSSNHQTNKYQTEDLSPINVWFNGNSLLSVNYLIIQNVLLQIYHIYIYYCIQQSRISQNSCVWTHKCIHTASV